MTKKAPPQLSDKELRKFGIVMAIAITLISLIGVWRQHWTMVYIFWGIAGIVFLLPGLIAPAALRPIHKGWMRFAKLLGWINARIILSILFYCIFTPISLFQKLTRRDALDRNFSKDAQSYWIDRSKEEYNPKHFERQF